MKFVKKLQKKQYISLAILAVMTIGVGSYSLWLHQPVKDIEYSRELSEDTALETRMLFAGDIYWGRRMNDWSQQSNLKEAYPFHRLHELQPEIYDAWIANLECPAVPGIHQEIGFVPELWEFNCDVKYLPEAAKWLDIVSLANNHTANQEREKGQTATREQLDKHGIQHFGGFNPHKEEDVCDVVSLPVRVRLDGQQQDAKLPVAMCGYHGVYYTITDAAIERMQEYAKYMPVVAHPHMGAEYQATIDDVRRELYRKMIDNGADAVIGNHSHWVQPVEAYKGKLIAYSLGNFIFDQQFSNEVMRSAAIDLTLTLKENAVSNETLNAWLKIGEQCEKWQDDCLDQAKKQKLERLPLNFSYHPVGIDTSNQITSRADQRLYDEILQRLEWEEVVPQLQ